MDAVFQTLTNIPVRNVKKNAELNSRPRQQPCVLRNNPASSVVNQH